MSRAIIVNASTLHIGGGIQVISSFISFFESSQALEFSLYYIINKKALKNINKDLYDQEKFLVLESSPAGFFSGLKERKKIADFTKKVKPLFIYSIGFPSYINFSYPEVGRYTNPWEIFDTLPWDLLSNLQKIKVYLRTKYRLYWARRVFHFETQTTLAKQAIIKKFHLSNDDVSIINNSINQKFLPHTVDIDYQSKVINIFCLSADHPHKNLKSTVKIASHLKAMDPKLNFRMITTLPHSSNTLREIQVLSKRHNVCEFFKNVGSLSIDDCIEYYKHSHVVLQPSLLEIFSATYIESMYLGIPLIVPNLNFTKDICKDGATYYNHNHPEEAAEAIIDLINDDILRKAKIERAKTISSEFADISSKYQKIIQMFRDTEKLITNNNAK